MTVLKSLLSLNNFNLHFKRNRLKFITIICTQNKIYVNEKILHWNTNKQVYDCTCYLYASLCWIPWPYPGSRLLTSTKICFHADLWKYQILAVPSLEPLRNLINHKIKWKKKKPVRIKYTCILLVSTNNMQVHINTWMHFWRFGMEDKNLKVSSLSLKFPRKLVSK